MMFYRVTLTIAVIAYAIYKLYEDDYSWLPDAARVVLYVDILAIALYIIWTVK